MVVFLLILSQGFDQTIFQEIYYDWRNPTMDVIMKGTKFLSGYDAIATGHIAIFYLGAEKEVKSAKLALAAGGTTAITATMIRGIVNRPRPLDTLHKNSRFTSSFPSGHTSSYFAMATVYSCKYPKLTIPLYSFGVLVGISRIYWGYHYPTDVIAGAALGLGIGYLTLKLEKKLQKLPFW